MKDVLTYSQAWILIFLFLVAQNYFIIAGMNWFEQDIVAAPLMPPYAIVVLMGNVIQIFTIIALYLVHRARISLGLRGNRETFALVLSSMVSFLWVLAFFYFHALSAAWWIGLFDLIIKIVLIPLVWRYSKTSAFLLIACALWVAFMLYLTHDLWVFNEAF